MKKYECGKCSGKGRIAAFNHVVAGVCFKCNGRGYVVRKSAPRPAKKFNVWFLWADEKDANYMGGEFCMCGVISARSNAEAERKAKARMNGNGSVDYRIEEVA